MKKKCNNCGMLRSTKDLVLLNHETYICFSCWNKKLLGKDQLNSKE